MIVELVVGKLVKIQCDTLVVCIPEAASLTENAAITEIDQALGGNLTVLFKEQLSCGRYGETTVIHTFGAIAAKQVILLGIGNSAKLTIDKIRSLTAIAARAASKLSAKTLALAMRHEAELTRFGVAGVQASVEGAYLGLYEFNHYKSKKKPSLLSGIQIVASPTDDTTALQAAVDKALIIADSVCFARDMVNHPSHYMTPERMAKHAEEIAHNFGVDLEILRASQIREQGLEALWSVAKGSDEPPVLIVLTYRGNPQNSEVLGLIGKGITFDSGGISLKPSEGMGEMKDDMGGAAAVLAAMKAIAQLKPASNILAVIPCAENMPSGRALKPGDVIGSHSGKTIEIISTDAEGRLVLADAISYARKLGATKLIDLATLTGACVVALGKVTSAIVANDESWSQAVLTAAVATGEKMWPLPAFDEYKEQIKSDIADLKNSGGRPAGAITAGLFLAEFANTTPWVHIDIAGTVTSEKENGYNPKGATGAGVRTLIQIAETT
ncbi:leucyl aminopeptidase [Anaerosporomusa subterranea]|uniref:Probable cytosol aminopeptidase n=1 Tax=Anaerosporomusa subterranea TaxID=1794912 RepID=A0A154BUF4_ANASB|nr:leucyl aminopeptidase [Anaerosporomusa subterranea]KYZ77138.1 leucyl aminopeptidase [Anaerosporomusa subterranea]